MTRRPIFFFAVLVGVLISLIPASIISRNAYASKISFLEATDFWLNLPLGKNAENVFIPSDFEVAG